MSFMKNILGKMSATNTSTINRKDEEDVEDDDDVSDGGTSTESSDTGIFAASDLESSGHSMLLNNVVDADCSAISNFFGYW